MSLARHRAGHDDEALCLGCAEPVELPADYCGACEKELGVAEIICLHIYGPWEALQFGSRERMKCLLAAKAVLAAGA